MEVQRIDLKYGNGVDMPEEGNKVRVDMKVWECDYEQPGNEYKGKRIPEKDQKDQVFIVGRGDTIKGLDTEIQYMSLGGMARLTVPSNLAFSNDEVTLKGINEDDMDEDEDHMDQGEDNI
ncbi:hypothetical protein GP486_002562 [Trichoglossum hirsutum]|uniref:peptidylprolyl isomerase n=1 Tax=Trichoglossum hirsutum TaxID=265104 RepID=A0A9P8LF00_9PEZI|nr:hypothetical protein GP486_002562 [Trichoglossum hirsutum]